MPGNAPRPQKPLPDPDRVKHDPSPDQSREVRRPDERKEGGPDFAKGDKQEANKERLPDEAERQGEGKV